MKMTMQRSQNGFTVIEVLVAVLIMAVGILGMAGLQVISIQQNRSALLRAEALQIGNDILDRIRANPEGTYDGVALADGPGTGITNCITNVCSETEMAAFDIAQWKCSINSEDAGGTTYAICTTFGIGGSLPAGAGSIALNADDVHVVTVQWSDGPSGGTSSITLRSRTSNN